MSSSNKVVYLDHPAFQQEEESAMRFRLTYEGKLRPTQPSGREDRLAPHKHEIRKHFHSQLKRLWQTNKFLSTKMMRNEQLEMDKRPLDDGNAYWGSDKPENVPLAEWMARQYEQFGYRFAPLIREEDSLLCSLDVLFLRRDLPGSVIHAGDIDNRVKTVIDALRRPQNASELSGYEKPGEDEDPFFVLLEDDKLVSQFSVETDTLLNPEDPENKDHQQVHLVITVDIKPYHPTYFNVGFS